MAVDYTNDGTYWTGRERSNGFIEVVRLRASDYGLVESLGSYQKRGAAVSAAAELAYHQGRKDALAEVGSKIQEALINAGITSVVVAQPDVQPEDLEEE